jgi:hypothetical protein
MLQGQVFLRNYLGYFKEIARYAELGRRLADKLIKVWGKDGEEAWVIR